MKLPASLTPWAQQLRIFPNEIRLALGAMAQKISPFVAPLRVQEEISNREPNGYDGVARRGIYERLLLSELSLADEIPEEFIRRAVMGEHLFLNLARTAPSAKRVSVALFNAGAEQLGTPRIAHLAALIVLARRAGSVQAAFEWGILQDKELKTFNEVTESNVLSLIKARTPETLKAEHITRWREKLGALDAPADVWLVGGDELTSFEEAKGFSILAVEDVLEPSVRELKISVKSASGIQKQTMLELPKEDVSTRLLRNPFEVYKSPVHVDTSTKLNSFFFDDNGGKIFARSGEKTIIYLPVANSPHAAAANPRQYSLNYQNDLLIAAGRLGKSVATLSFTESGHLRLDYPKAGNFRLSQGNYLIENAEQLVLPDNNQTLLPIYNLRLPNSQLFQAAFSDAKNNLFLLNTANNLGTDLEGRAFLIATDLLAAVRTEQRFIFVGCEVGSKISQIVSYGEQTERKDLPIAQVTQAFFGRGIGIAHRAFGLLALGDTNSNFVIIKNDEEKHIQASLTSEVVGVFYDPSFSPEVGLIELEADRRTLNFNVGRKYHKQIFISGEEIEKIAFSPRSPVCAYQTVSGEVVIFSFTHRVPIGSFGA
jgi:hypothetical protein